MAMDRLAALRAQRQQQYDAPSSPHLSDAGYELNPVNQPSPAINGSGTSDNFYDEISAIQEMINHFNTNVSRISDLHSRSLNAVDGAGQQNLALLDDQVAQTRDLGNQVKKRIETLKKQPIPRGQESRKNQVTVVARQFMTALQNYTQVERDYRQKQRTRVERQFKIVKPDATTEEVAAVVDNTQGGGDQIFANALSTSNRYGESRAAYREVQDRHEDIRKIERTLEELAQMFNDMSVLVAQQDETIDYVGNIAQNVEQDVTKGVEHTDKAVKSAKAARRKRWICFWLFILLILVIAGVVAGVVVSQNN